MWCLPVVAGFFAPAAVPREPLTVRHGIPKMFRWLTDQYPTIMERISDVLPETGSAEPVSNLYLDMNGIIHQCSQGDLTMKEQFVRIFEFTDKVCKLVSPTSVIYLAVDGIAPRAKINQQRARRFRSAAEREQLRQELVAAGQRPPDFDSNCITPGTDFMDKLGLAFKAWLEYKIQTDPFYKQKIYFSGPDVPGEGEHKVMEYLRQNNNTRHCFYGLDADLIMLSLVTHKPNFILLREKMRNKKDPLTFTRFDFEILEIGLLRQMIYMQFNERGSIERLVDDFVFLCMLVGNDFLPHMPHLDILDGSLDLSMSVYKELNGFLTDKAKLHLPRFELLCRALASFEPSYFARRAVQESCPEYEDDYRTHYYQTKFGFDPQQHPERIRQLAQDYVLGLFWCLEYYHHGVKSWDWFYPHLYAPLASDLVNLMDLKYEFPSSDSKPFTPLMQLLSVLPPQSAKLLPPSYAQVMTNELKYAYPTTFKTDPNGKLQPWEAIVLIPFIDEDKLIGHLSQIDHVNALTLAERRRNDMSNATVWVSPSGDEYDAPLVLEQPPQDTPPPPKKKRVPPTKKTPQKRRRATRATPPSLYDV